MGNEAPALKGTKEITSAESIAVIVIATVLSAAVLFILAGYAFRAENTRAEAEGHMILTAVQVHAWERGLKSVTLDDPAELESVAVEVSTLTANTVTGPDGIADTQIINSVTIDNTGKVTRLTYITSTGKTVIYSGDTFTVG
jgi:type II secretory pathway pseudopilin PulG